MPSGGPESWKIRPIKPAEIGEIGFLDFKCFSKLFRLVLILEVGCQEQYHFCRKNNSLSDKSGAAFEMVLEGTVTDTTK